MGVGYCWPTGPSWWCIAVYRTKNSQTKQKREDKVRNTESKQPSWSLSSVVPYTGTCSDKHTLSRKREAVGNKNLCDIHTPCMWVQNGSATISFIHVMNLQWWRCNKVMKTDTLADQVGKHLFSWHLSETFYYPTTFIGNRSSSTAKIHCCMQLQFKQLYAFTHILTAIPLHVVYIKTFYNAKVITFHHHNFTDVQKFELPQ
jgi:hypothetical protein